MSNSSVITKEEGQIKRGCNTDFCRPKFAVMNPELTMTLPDYQTACGCTDILMHTMERYFTNGGNMEITDGIAEALMRTVMVNAQILCEEPKNYDARAEIMWAGSLSHNGLTGCGAQHGGDWASHAIEHELSGMFDVTHGAGLAAVWASWARYVYKENPARFAKLAENVFGIKAASAEQGALDGIKAMEDFFRSIDMPVSLKELKVNASEEQIDTMALKCSFNKTRTIGTFKKLGYEDLKLIYQAAAK